MPSSKTPKPAVARFADHDVITPPHPSPAGPHVMFEGHGLGTQPAPPSGVAQTPGTPPAPQT